MKDIRVGDVVLWDKDYWLVSALLKNNKHALFLEGCDLEERTGEEIIKVFREVKGV
jgi:hypothetical protein